MSKSQSLVSLLAASSVAEGERCGGGKEGNKLSSQSRGLYNQLNPFIRTALQGSNIHPEAIAPKSGESELKFPTQELWKTLKPCTAGPFFHNQGLFFYHYKKSI